MTDYSELVKALRFETDYVAVEKTMRDAAAAIEALNRLVDLNTERCEGLREQLRKAQEQYERHLNELEAQLPKRGEWIVRGANRVDCSVCGHSICFAFGLSEGSLTGYNYCPNCGAKMEVQE